MLSVTEPQLLTAWPLACFMNDSLPCVITRRDSAEYSVPSASYLVLNIGENPSKNIHFHRINPDPAEQSTHPLHELARVVQVMKVYLY